MALRRSKKPGPRSDDDLLQEALAQLASAERHMQPIVERIYRARKVYRGTSNAEYGKPRDESDPRAWRARDYPPIAFEQAELLAAEMTIDDPRFNFTARQASFADNAAIAEDALDYYNDRDRFSRTFRLAMREAVRDGGSVIKTIWAKDYGRVFDDDGAPARDPETGAPLRTLKHEGLKHVRCRIEDIFPDPTGRDFDECRYVFHRVRASLDDLKSRRNADGSAFYKNLAKLTPTGGTEGNEKRRDDETQEAFIARTQGVHTLHERWTPYGRLTIANKSVVIRRDDELPFKHGCVPFTMIRLIDDEDCIVGISLMNLIDDLQSAFHKFWNRLQDAIELAVDPPMLIDIEEDIKSAGYIVKPHAKIPARNGEQTVKVLQDVAGLDKYNIMALLDYIRGLMERVTGMNSSIAGTSNASTATESALNLRQGKGRSGAMLSVADECWATLADRSYQLIQQFGSSEVMQILSDGRQVQFAPEQLTDMLITAKSAASERNLKDLVRQDAQSRWDLVSAAAAGAGSPGMPQIDLTAELTEAIEAFGGDPRATIVGPPMPMMPPDQGMPGPMGPGPMANQLGPAPSGPPQAMDASQDPTVFAPQPGEFVA